MYFGRGNENEDQIGTSATTPKRFSAEAGDQLLKGAALNAVQIAELLLGMGAQGMSTPEVVVAL